MIAYYFRNKDMFTLKTQSNLSKIADEDEAYDDINDIIIELTEKHKTPVLALITGGKL